MSNEVLGMVGTKGLAGAIEVVDAMTETANVALIGYEKIGSGLVTVVAHGDMGVVKVSANADAVAAANVGQVISQHVAPRPHTDVEKILPKSLQGVNKCIPTSMTDIQTSGRG